MKSAALMPLAAVRGTAANSAVTVGLIGSGGRGTFDSSLLVKLPNARLVARCDIFDDRIERNVQNGTPETPENTNIILRFDIKLGNHNSGVQFRKHGIAGFCRNRLPGGRFRSGRSVAWGNFYEEKGRGRDVMKTQDCAE